MNDWQLELGQASESTARIDDVMLLWTDPPYGTGKRQGGSAGAYTDVADTRYVIDALLSWLPQMNPDGTIVTCCDYRLAPRIATAVMSAGWHYRGEIVWQFGLGRPRETWWPVRHNNILTFTRTATSGHFDRAAIPRVVRRAPKPGYPADKPSGSVWDFTMSNTHPQRVGYPNQKPLEIVEPFVLAHTRPGDLVADPFCGSSTTGVAAVANGRRFCGIDNNPEAIQVSQARLSKAGWCGMADLCARCSHPHRGGFPSTQHPCRCAEFGDGAA